ncbi:MAG: RluA family pseudouridine synthase [Gemmataceae bacterium]|nr:RluA family pseudouridine synthase [Gemmataceae bacterium]
MAAHYSLSPFAVTPQEAGHTLAKVLRARLGGPSWTQVRRLITARRVLVNENVCTDDARRLQEGETVTLLDHPRPLPATAHPQRLVLRYWDEHIVVVEKPAGINTVRHPLEQHWSQERRRRSPTLEDLTQWALAGRLRHPWYELPRLRIVHRLDRETSGLLVFARTAEAERALGRQFQLHTVFRRYLAIVVGQVSNQTFRSRLVRDRGDGRRGSTSNPHRGKEAVTHVETIEYLPGSPGYTLLSCRLETGRTHQIRIHLAEAGHPVCGEKVYVRCLDGRLLPDPSNAPRLALHAAELGFLHPATRQPLHWSMPLPTDLARFLERLKCEAFPGRST